MRWRKPLVCVFVTLAMLVPIAPASAVNEYLCEGVPTSGFTDVGSNSFEPFIDCLVWWGITAGTGPTTFSPAAPVDRWQMAVFLMRLWTVTSSPPSGASQGFTDISALTVEAQTAINQVAQLSVTAGVAPGLFSPTTQVTRWQMAIFLSRFVYAAQFALPAPSPTGFTDIDGLSVEAQDAISVVKSLGITSGTSATTFSPNDVVTREQMAAFLVRTMQVTFSLSVSAFTDSCTMTDGVETCTGAGSWWIGVPLTFAAGWWTELPGDTTAIDSPGTSVDLFIDGVLQTSTPVRVQLSGVILRTWFVNLPGGLAGSHMIEARYYSEGVLLYVDSVSLTFD
jgi:hypothetical protein